MKNYVKNGLKSVLLAGSLFLNQGCYKNVDVSNKIENVDKGHLKTILKDSGFVIKTPIYEHDENFDELYNYFNNIYVPAYNKCMINKKNPDGGDFYECNHNDKLEGFLEIDNKTKDFDFFGDADENTKYFKKHGKVYKSSSAINNNKIASFKSGDIILEGTSIYRDYEMFMPYNIVIYEQKAEQYDELMGWSIFAFWDDKTNTAYLNLDNGLKWANTLKSLSEIDVKNTNSEKNNSFIKLYNILLNDSKKNNTSYEEEFIRMLVQTTIKHHEPAHELFMKYGEDNSMSYDDIEKIVDSMEKENIPKRYRLEFFMF